MPCESDFAAVAHMEGVGFRFGTFRDVLVAHLCQHYACFHICNLNVCAIPAVAVAVCQVEGDLALIITLAYVGVEVECVGPIAVAVETAANGFHFNSIFCSQIAIKNIRAGDIFNFVTVYINNIRRCESIPCDGGSCDIYIDTQICRDRASDIGGEIDWETPVAVNASAVGFHFDGVGGLRKETGQCVRILGDCHFGEV